MSNCNSLAFKPAFRLGDGCKDTRKANGASLRIERSYRAAPATRTSSSVFVQLPKQLPSRLTTLQKACPEAVFASNPSPLPAGSFVGGAQGQHADAGRETDRPGDPRLARRPSVPGSGSGTRSRRRARDPGRQHEHQERDHHDPRSPRRRTCRSSSITAQPAGRAALRADRQRQPLRRASCRCRRRSSPKTGRTFKQNTAISDHQLPGADRRAQGRRQRRLPDRSAPTRPGGSAARAPIWPPSSATSSRPRKRPR